MWRRRRRSREKHYVFMYFKGIIKNNETNFLACRIIGFVALIFLFFSCRCLCACVRDSAPIQRARRAAHSPHWCNSQIQLSLVGIFHRIYTFFLPPARFTAARPSSAGRRPERTQLFLFMLDARDITPALLPLIKSSNLDRFMRYIIFYCYVLWGFRTWAACMRHLNLTPQTFHRDTHTHPHASARVILGSLSPRTREYI